MQPLSRREGSALLLLQSEVNPLRLVLREGMNIDDLTTGGQTKIRDDENAFMDKEKDKITIKRDKAQEKLVQVNGRDGGSDTESEPESSDSSLADGQEANGYSQEQIPFLEKMKGRWAVKDFPNRSLFVESAKWLIRHRGADGLMETEVYGSCKK